LNNRNITGKAAENALHDAGITVNKNMVPFDTRSPFITSGIRLGTAALTTKGMKESEMEIVADFISEVLDYIDDESVRKNIIEKIRQLNKDFQLYSID
jgi:glycine hydroxymethyltransferase